MKRIAVRKKMLACLLVLGLAFCASLSALAQVGPGDPGGDDDVPITGIEWLLLGGGALGARKIYLKYRNRS